MADDTNPVSSEEAEVAVTNAAAASVEGGEREARSMVAAHVAVGAGAMTAAAVAIAVAVAANGDRDRGQPSRQQ